MSEPKSDAPRGRASDYGIVAEFATSGQLLAAAERLANAGYTKFDAHSPFPIHGMDKAMKLGQSKLPLIVFACGCTGLLLGLTLQTWVHVEEYPLVIGGKPFFALPAFIPVMFETTVLLSAFGAVFGMLGLNKLPMPYHPVFNHSTFVRCSDDKFFISVEAADAKYNKNATRELLTELGAQQIEIVSE